MGMTPKILVVKTTAPFRNSHKLRIHFVTDSAGVIRFETNNEFSKREANLRAMLLSSKYGFDRDELPDHPEEKADQEFLPEKNK